MLEFRQVAVRKRHFYSGNIVIDFHFLIHTRFTQQQYRAIQTVDKRKQVVQLTIVVDINQQIPL